MAFALSAAKAPASSALCSCHSEMPTPHPDFPVIDAHVHLYPDSLAPKVVPILSNRFGNAPAFDGTVAK
jgi:hypothetical protein